MSELKFLDLSHNKISSISGKFWSNKIETLDLSHNQLKKFKMNLIYAVSEKQINVLLQSNDLNAIIFSDLQVSSDAHHVKVFIDESIENCNCQTINLLQFIRSDAYKELREQIKVYPENIRCKNHDQKHLRDLELSDLECPFSEKECPFNCICNLPRGKYVLKIKCSEISEFPKLPSVMSLKKKQVEDIHLHLSNNKLTVLPQEMPESWFIVSELNISYNYIRNLESHHLPTRKLDVRNNCFTTLNDEVCEKLKFIDSLYINSIDDYCPEKSVENITSDEIISDVGNYTQKVKEHASYTTNYVLAAVLILPIVVCGLFYASWKYLVLNRILVIDDLPNSTIANNNLFELQPINYANDE